MKEIPSLFEFILQIGGGGFVSVIIAFLLEHIRPFQELKPEAKKWAVLGLYVFLPLAATAAVQYVPASVWTELEPYWRALALGFLGWLGSQAAHMWDKRRGVELFGEELITALPYEGTKDES